jgi:hypothetical protein
MVAEGRASNPARGFILSHPADLRRSIPDTMTDTFPDRLSLDPRSPFHDAELLGRGVGIRFNGQERTNVEEYCISEGWIRVVVGKALDRRGHPMTMKIKGEVVPYLLDAAPADDGTSTG